MENFSQLSSTFRYYLLDHPQIRHFDFSPANTFGGSPTFVATTVVAYLTSTFLLSRYVTPTLPSSLLRVISAVHNLVLLLLSLFMALGTATASITSLPISSLCFCFPAMNPPPRSGPLFFWAYVYYLSKFYEFIDTLLIILNKNNSGRRLSFLHVYHHAAVVVVSYLWLATRMPLFHLALTINASVHVLMYAYYMLCAVGIRPRWKKIVTNVQILQFMVGFFVSPPMLYVHVFRSGCSGMSGWLFTAVFDVSLLYLFIDFHLKNYAGQRNKMKTAADDKQS